jgi:putative sigma-54 modulation protein
MRLELTGQHVDITPTLRRLVEAKLGKLERMLNDSAVSAQAVLKRERNRCRADITLHTRGEKFLHGAGAAIAWEPAVNLSIEKIQQQAQKVKGKWEARKRRGRRAPLAIDSPEAAMVVPVAAAPAERARVRMPRIFRAERQTIQTMSIADAARHVNRGNPMIVFRDAETSGIAVLFRHEGELTLVETER